MKPTSTPLSPSAGYRAPWSLTLPELRAYRVPTPLPDGTRSLHPAELAGGVPAGHEPLFKATPVPHHHAFSQRPGYVRRELLKGDVVDVERLERLLGKGTRYADDRQLAAARWGYPVKVYRATDAESEVWPGAWVFTSRAAAADHLAEKGYPPQHRILKGFAAPSDLHTPPGYPHAGEFLYLPDLERWYRGALQDALRSGKAVPEHVARQEFAPRIEREAPDLDAFYRLHGPGAAQQHASARQAWAAETPDPGEASALRRLQDALR